MQLGEGYKGLLARLGRAAGLSALATATLASGPCSNCDPNSETTWTLANLRAERDKVVPPEASGAAGESGVGGGTAGSPSQISPGGDNVTLAKSWNGVDCPTPEQFNAIMRLNARGELVEKLTDNRGDSCSYQSYEVCGEGRPFLVAGEARLPSVASAASTARHAVDAVDWLADAKMEHASVAAFARLSLQLLALGAPVDLVRDAQRASLDELRHAEFCFRMASREAGSVLQAGPLPVHGALADVSLENLIETNLLEGCIGETLAAARLQRRAASSTDPLVKQTLLAMAEDEARHAELAFRILGWCSRRAPERTASAIEGLLSEVAHQQRFDANDSSVWRAVLAPLLFGLRRASDLAA